MRRSAINWRIYCVCLGTISCCGEPTDRLQRCARQLRSIISMQWYTNVPCMEYRPSLPAVRWSLLGCSQSHSRQTFLGGPNPSLHISPPLPFTFPSLSLLFPSLAPLRSRSLKYSYWIGGNAVSSVGFAVEPQRKSNLVHFSVKIWHHVSPVLLIFLRIKEYI